MLDKLATTITINEKIFVNIFLYLIYEIFRKEKLEIMVIWKKNY